MISAALILTSSVGSTDLKCADVKSIYQTNECCGASVPKTVSGISRCPSSTGQPVQWSKEGIFGKTGTHSLADAKASIHYLLDELFPTMPANEGRSWGDMQVQQFNGVPVDVAPNPTISHSMSSHTLIDARIWSNALQGYSFPGCNIASGATKSDAVAVCKHLYLNPTATEYQQGSCFMKQYDPSKYQFAFNFNPAAPIDAFHYNEWLQISASDAASSLNAEWRANAVQNLYVWSKCGAELAEVTWDTPPIATLGLVDQLFNMRILVYDGLDDIFKGKYPCTVGDETSRLVANVVLNAHFGGYTALSAPLTYAPITLSTAVLGQVGGDWNGQMLVANGTATIPHRVSVMAGSAAFFMTVGGAEAPMGTMPLVYAQTNGNKILLIGDLDNEWGVSHLNDEGWAVESLVWNTMMVIDTAAGTMMWYNFISQVDMDWSKYYAWRAANGGDYPGGIYNQKQKWFAQSKIRTPMTRVVLTDGLA